MSDLPAHRAATIALLAALHCAAAPAQPHVPPLPGGAPYPGEIGLRVDATDLDHRVFSVQQTLPVQPGPLTLYFPRWLPGTHAPAGNVNLLAGLRISAGGEAVPWQRDPLDTHAFRIEVPAGVGALDLEFQHLSPLGNDDGRVAVTREMLDLQWSSVVLYPAGYAARAIQVRPTLVLPPGWTAATALRAEAGGGDTLRYRPVTLEALVDSPVYAGRHVRRIELDPPGAARPVALNLVADSAEQLEASEAQIEAHRELVRQADRLFGSRHYAHYDFLLALSEELGRIGLEHHQSSENGVRPDYWEHWDQRIGARELLPHEYAHSWNGKFRRPADLNTPDYNVPMQNSLLWQYEGQTEYWGWVLAARSGLVTPQQARDRLAQIAADCDRQTGRAWRSLRDTTHDAIVARGVGKDWQTWQRSSADYYFESLLVWLDADTLIREQSAGRRSLDDFARSFFGVDDGATGPLPYRFDDIVAALDAVQPHDWSAFLRRRLDAPGAPAPLDGLARAGWKLEFTDVQSDSARADELEAHYTDLNHALGLTVGRRHGGARANSGPEARIGEVVWGSPAFQAGLTPGLILLAVNHRAYKPERLKAAITGNKDGQAPIELLLREGETFRSVSIDYRGGLRYPRLERIAGSEDRLAALLGRR